MTFKVPRTNGFWQFLVAWLAGVRFDIAWNELRKGNFKTPDQPAQRIEKVKAFERNEL